jgi:hypothetical protein
LQFESFFIANAGLKGAAAPVVYTLANGISHQLYSRAAAVTMGSIWKVEIAGSTREATLAEAN